MFQEQEHFQEHKGAPEKIFSQESHEILEYQQQQQAKQALCTTM